MRINHELSDPTPIISGVIQGGFLGPHLFIIFIEDISELISDFNVVIH